MQDLHFWDTNCFINVRKEGIFLHEASFPLSILGVQRKIGDRSGVSNVGQLPHQTVDSQVIILHDSNSRVNGDGLRLVLPSGARVYGDVLLATLGSSADKFYGLSPSQVWLTLNQMAYCILGLPRLNIYFVDGKLCYHLFEIEIPENVVIELPASIGK